jgi:hypothetical protein
MPLYGRLDLEWDCSYRLPLVGSFYFDLMTDATGFDVKALALDRPGLKVFDFRLNFYHESEQLLAARQPGKGTRGLRVDLLAAVSASRLPAAPAGEINAHWRSVAQCP